MITSTSTSTIIIADRAGTRFRLFVTADPLGGLQWAWIPSTTWYAAGWAAPHRGGEVQVSLGGRRITKVDRAAITELLDQVRS